MAVGETTEGSRRTNRVLRLPDLRARDDTGIRSMQAGRSGAAQWKLLAAPEPLRNEPIQPLYWSSQEGAER